MLISQILSLFIYFYTIIFFNNVFDLSYMDISFFWKIVVITLISWLPLHIFKLIIKKIDPTDYEKVMSAVNLQKKTPNIISQIEII